MFGHYNKEYLRSLFEEENTKILLCEVDRVITQITDKVLMCAKEGGVQIELEYVPSIHTVSLSPEKKIFERLKEVFIDLGVYLSVIEGRPNTFLFTLNWE